MKKAEDTVIVMLPIPTDKLKVVQAVKTQAKITWDIAFKLGEKQGYDKGVKDKIGIEEALLQKVKTERQAGYEQCFSDNAGCSTAIYRAGAKDIVDWIRWQSGLAEWINMHHEDEWQAKLKERGIDAKL